MSHRSGTRKLYRNNIAKLYLYLFRHTLDTGVKINPMGVERWKH